MRLNANMLVVYFLALCVGVTYILMGPNGVDLDYYAKVSPHYERFYFYRELLSWSIIDFLNNFDQTGTLIAFFMANLLFISTIYFSRMLTGNMVIAVLTSMLLTYSNFYLLLSVNGLRQGISLIFLLISCYFFYKGAKFYVFTFCMAVLSHNSALVFLPIFLIKSGRHTLFLLVCVAVIFAGEFLSGIAAKNNNPSPLMNKAAFLILSSFILVIALFHRLTNKFDRSQLGLANYVVVSQVYLYSIGLAFYETGFIYERLVYTLVPLMIVYTNFWLNFYRPKVHFLFLYSLLIIFSITYSITHPSVTNHFKFL